MAEMKNNNTKDTLKIYWWATLKYKYSVLAVLLSVIGGVVVGAVVPLYFKKFFDLLASGQDKTIVVNGLIGVLITIAFLEAAGWVFWRLSNFIADYYQPKVFSDLANMCFAYLHKHSYSYFTDNFGGSLMKKVKWFVSSYENILDRITWNFLPLGVNIVIVIGVLFRLRPYLAAGLLTWVIIFLYVNWLFTRYKMKYDIKRSEAETFSSGLLADTITNHNNVKLFNGYDREVAGYAEANENLRKLRKFTWNLDSFFQAVQGVFTIILEIGIFYYAIRLWQEGFLTLGDFVLIQSYILSIIMRIWDFGNMIRRVYQSLSDAEEMTEILKTPHEIVDAPGAKELVVSRGEIEFKDVVFNYRETRAVLKGLNLSIAPAERVAIIGPSGAGKTTIVKLLFRMHEVTGGHILVDGQDIARVKLESLWQNVSLVPQDPILFHRTLMENIRYGRPEATDEEVISAARAANCHDFIMNSPEGYKTYVGERGIKLSGGERQRVAIARAILKNAPILVLDEATSSLDSESEHLIQEALERLMKGKTVIVIAHRLSTIRQMDRIIVVAKGGVAEEGTHDSLVAKDGGLYNRLWQFQAGGFIK